MGWLVGWRVLVGVFFGVGWLVRWSGMVGWLVLGWRGLVGEVA